MLPQQAPYARGSERFFLTSGVPPENLIMDLCREFSFFCCFQSVFSVDEDTLVLHGITPWWPLWASSVRSSCGKALPR